MWNARDACIDNLLDLVNVPLAFVAGAVVMSGVLPDVHPYLKWSIAGLLGSSAAGLTQLATTIIRGVGSIVVVTIVLCILGSRSKRIAVSVAKPRRSTCQNV